MTLTTRHMQPLVHRCVVRRGPVAGNKVSTEVTICNMENLCPHCEEPLATVQDLVLHMYDELTTPRELPA